MPISSISFGAGYLVLAAMWLQLGELWGLALAALFVLLGSALLLLAAIGVDAVTRSLHGTLVRLGEGIRDPRDTLTHILMLTEHSRRNGLIGLGEVESNWPPLQRVCTLVSCAADEQRIRLEANSTIELARQRANHIVMPWLFLAAALVCTGALAWALSAFAAAQKGVFAVPAHSYAPVVVALVAVVLVVLPILMRLMLAREREANCIQIAYEGGLKILHNNNVDAVFHGLVELVPGAPATVTASEIGELETGRGPWL
ncbi:MAG: hypothetical protein AAF499_06130 [Pseudomonadota bacterium]